MSKHLHNKAEKIPADAWTGRTGIFAVRGHDRAAFGDGHFFSGGMGSFSWERSMTQVAPSVVQERKPGVVR